jgi:hypothetical protein
VRSKDGVRWRRGEEQRRRRKKEEKEGGKNKREISITMT